MKRFVAVLLCLMMLLSLFSCETPVEKNDISTSEEADTPFDSGTKPPETDPGENSGVVHPEAKKAMEMYESAINGEICVLDEQLGEIELKNCRFASDNLKLDEYDMLNKAILDLDGDGLCEYVIQSPLKDHLVLRYHDGKVYCYSFDFKSLFKLNTDGTFYWYSQADGSIYTYTMGLNRISFDGSSIVVKEIYRLEDIGEWAEYAEEYYLDGRQVTREEYLEYYNHNHKAWAQFSPFELSCQYPITAEEAWRIADDYLGNPDGGHDVATGKYFVYKVIITEKPTVGAEYYTVILQDFLFRHHYDGWEVWDAWDLPTYQYATLVVNAITGECGKYNDIIPDGK